MHVTKTRSQQAEYQKRCDVMSLQRYTVREIKGSEKKIHVLQYLTFRRLMSTYSGRTAPLTSKVAFYIFIQQI